MAMSKWSKLHVSDQLCQALEKQGFVEPTPIQEVAIPAVIKHNKDVLGAAVTGSGKTLAFAVPIIEFVLSNRNGRDNPSCQGLVLTPTRELAAQIKKHIDDVGQHLDIKTACVVGGLSLQKQQRLVSKFKPDIIVATPGRLWDFIQESNTSRHEPYLTTTNIKRVPFLVIDEADRMTEKGHFEDLTKIADLLNNQADKGLDEDGVDESMEDGSFSRLLDLECVDEEGNVINDPGSEVREVEQPETITRRTLIFSATLTFVHDVSSKRNKSTRNKKKQKEATYDKLSNMISFFGLDTDEIKVIDLTTKGIGKPSSDKLAEYSIPCKKEDKDNYLYYLLKEPLNKKVIVFCNSKDCLRRLASVLKLLNIPPIALHADLDQKRRMQAIESFSSSSTSILLASDVAARGLDICDVDVVVHYQVPRTTETYVHRSGRTARGVKTGTAVVFVEPSEGYYYDKLITAVNGGKQFDLFPVKEDHLRLLSDRVKLAQQIDIFEHRFKRKRDDESWFSKMARAADIAFDDRDDLRAKYSDQDEKNKTKLITMKRSLKAMLSNQTVTTALKIMDGRLLKGPLSDNRNGEFAF
jgi:ATP-dependent RNA helicase DDX24/MAK5